MIRIYDTYDQGDASLLSSILNAEGIAHILQTGQDKGHFEPPSIWVLRTSDLQRAEEIVAEYRRVKHSSPQRSDGWKCRKCGEDHHGTFSTCWNCGSERR